MDLQLGQQCISALKIRRLPCHQMKACGLAQSIHAGVNPAAQVTPAAPDGLCALLFCSSANDEGESHESHPSVRASRAKVCPRGSGTALSGQSRQQRIRQGLQTRQRHRAFLEPYQTEVFAS
jgi:hypothetical protein